LLTLNQPQKLKISMSYTEELLTKADEVIPRVTFEDYKSDINEKIMIDVRQFEELQASGTVQGSIHVPKGVIEFRLNNNDDISFDTSVYVFCAVGVRSAIAGYNLKKVGYKKVFNLVGFQDILEQGAEKQSLI
jgi:rhodanese-related sulfurtransferase